MHRLKPSYSRAKAHRNPISKFGIAFLGIGTLLTLLGFIRGELAATISGITLLLYALIAVFCVSVTRLFWRRILITAEWSGLEYITLHSTPTVRHPRFSLFFLFCDIRFSVRYATQPESADSATFVLSVPVTRNEAKQRVLPPPRGIYRGDTPLLTISDLAGIFCLSIPQPDTRTAGTLVSHPEAETCTLPILPPGRSGQYAGKSTFKRSEELYETRAYLPGDDPRKINWKIFAHTGELSIREGELLPPPSSEYVIIVNPHLPESQRTGLYCTATRRDAAKLRFEALVRRAAQVALFLSEKNRIVTILAETESGAYERVCVSPNDGDKRNAILRALASCRVHREESAQDVLSAALSGKRETTYLFFMMPEQVAPSVSPQGNVLLLLGPVFAPPRPLSLRDRLRRSLFIDEAHRDTLNTLAYQARYAESLSMLKKGALDVQSI